MQRISKTSAILQKNIYINKLNFKIMTKPLKEYKFRYVGGMFVNVSDDSETLADILQQYDIIVDDRTQFARLYDYEREISI